MTPLITKKLVYIPINSIKLEGNLDIPQDTKAIIIFAHGAGSSRLSSRNNFVAQKLQQAGLATLLFDLLTEKEDTIYQNRFNIDLLTERLISVTNWLIKQPQTKNMKIGYFGASTGAAAALEAARQLGDQIGAIVSRGGRPDLALASLPQVKSPTLLIVGGNDELVIELNQKAYQALNTQRDLQIISGATHLFEEPGTLEKVADLAKDWFLKYL